jgi:PAS domain S-box-containing protein
MLPSEAELARWLMAETPDAVIFADREGRVRLWNRGAEELFGYTAAEALGQSLDLIIPEHLRARHWEGYQRVMATGATRYGRQLLAVPGRGKDGRRLSLEFTLALLRDAGGTVLGAGAIIRDVTARWEELRALRDRLAALEGRR